MRPQGFGIDWHAIFRFPAGSLSSVWFRGEGEIDRVIGALAATRLWSDLDVIGQDARPGVPFASAAEVADLVRRTDGGRFALAHGPPQAAQLLSQTDASR
jgi:hypothetical protein